MDVMRHHNMIPNDESSIQFVWTESTSPFWKSLWKATSKDAQFRVTETF